MHTLPVEGMLLSWGGLVHGAGAGDDQHVRQRRGHRPGRPLGDVFDLPKALQALDGEEEAPKAAAPEATAPDAVAVLKDSPAQGQVRANSTLKPAARFPPDCGEIPSCNLIGRG